MQRKRLRIKFIFSPEKLWKSNLLCYFVGGQSVLFVSAGRKYLFVSFLWPSGKVVNDCIYVIEIGLK